MIIEHLGLNPFFTIQYKKLLSKYGEKMLDLEGISDSKIVPMMMLDRLFTSKSIADASIDDSANIATATTSTVRNETTKPLWKLFSHNKIFSELKDEYGLDFANEWLEGQINGEYYLHDATSASMSPYCYSFPLRPVAEKGLFFIDNMRGGRAKHLSTFVDHVAEFINYSSNQLSGAVALPSLLLWLYKFWLDDVASGEIPAGREHKEKIQSFQKLIFRVNQPTVRDGIQSAYVNAQILDRPHLFAFFGADKFTDGTDMADYFDGFIGFQNDFLEYINELRSEFFFTYPVLTASLKIDEHSEYEDDEVARQVVRHNMAWQDCNIYNAREITSLSSCCRLVNDLEAISKNPEKIDGFFSSIGGTSISIGSMKVNTINFARIAYEANGDFNKYKTLLRKKIRTTHKVLAVHRKIIQQLIDRGRLPIYKHGLIDKTKQFSTVGINGLFSSIQVMGGIDRNQIGEVSYNKKGNEMMLDIFAIITEENNKTLDLYGYTANAEQVPGESAGRILIEKDRLLYDQVDPETYIYENQWIPLIEQADMYERILTSAKYDPKCGGGAILHVNIGEPIKDFDTAWEIANTIAKEGVIYYSLIHKFSYCNNDHSFYGETCPICGEDKAGYGIKIVGYIVKSQNFHSVRKRELEEREFYDI